MQLSQKINRFPAENLVALASVPKCEYSRAGMRTAIRSLLSSWHGGEAAGESCFSGIVPAGARVLIKPNWVYHENDGTGGMDCMLTHQTVIDAVLDELLLAKPSHITVGDAPIQLCDFDAIATPTWKEYWRERSRNTVEFVDYRCQTSMSSSIGDGLTELTDKRERFSLFDLAESSLLQPVSQPPGRFRVTNYDPDILARTHRPDKHQYLICREFFEADVVINLPKLKTHRKAGLTGALKNLVGINGHKDYLPHHRIGGTVLGGDCYHGLAPVKRLAEFCLDQANRRLGDPSYQAWKDRVATLKRWNSRLHGDPELEGSWHGNDTVWRMVLDLNRIARYGRADGTMSREPERIIFTLTDAVIAGQAEGPLYPVPLPLGVLTFATSQAFADLLHTVVMGFDPSRIPLVNQSFESFDYPLTDHSAQDCTVVTEGNRNFTLGDIADRFGVQAIPPAGWQSHLLQRGN